MKLPTSPRTLLCALFVAASSTLAHAQYTPSQNENILWGQATFGTAATGTTNGTFSTPTQVTTDPKTGQFYVVDKANNRVLRFSSASAFVNGAGAECVFGQPDFITGTDGLSDTEMTAPQGAVVDSTGHLWVADSGNNRVLRYDDASSAVLTVGTAITAAGVLGQVDFDSDVADVTQSNMHTPTGLTVDASGSLYVVDQANNRILKFTSPSTKLDGGLADALIGQLSYLGFAASTTASTFNTPQTALVDSSNNLWVADKGNNRVLLFSSASSLGATSSASNVLGQGGFFTGAAALSDIGLNAPAGLSLDVLGRLNVSDSGNNRIVVFQTPTTTAPGSAASFVLGQPDFFTGTATTSQTGLSNPGGQVFLSNQIFVADQSNNRIVSFILTPGKAAITAPTGIKLPTTSDKSFNIVLGNSSLASDSFKVTLTIPSATKNLAKLNFLLNGVNITSQLLAGTYTPTLAGGAQQIIKVGVSPKSKAKKSGGKISFSLTMTSKTSSVSASQTVKATFKKPKK